jgi:hypothetical protein
MKIALKSPITVGEGESAKKIESLELDLEKLTGADYMFALREAEQAKGEPIVYFELDSYFRREIAALACGLASPLLTKLRLDDFTKVDRTVRNFLIESDSE